MLALMAPTEDAPYSASLRRRSSDHDVTVASPLKAGAVQSVDAREDIFLDGDEASHVFEILDGIVCAYRILPDGERHIIAFYYPGDVLGYCCLGGYAYSAQALTSVRMRRIPRTILERSLTQKPELAQRLLHMAALELAATRDHLVCLAAKSAEAKAASFLLALSRRNEITGEDPYLIRLPMTRLDIADYLGLTIETVSRMFNKFKRAGWIDLPRATLVVIKDAGRLSRLAES
jgi:CRP/FNR family transcriptional regulator